jgi:hypothetical protein
MIWLHVLAVAYAPTYLKENANGIRVGWPRVPLPKSRTLLRVSSRLGADLADLLDTERAVVGVTHGTIRRPLKTIATIERVGGGSLSLDNGDLRVTAGWGYGRDVTMPGSGTMKERNYSEEECVHFEHDSKLSEVLDLLGRTTCNVYLNEVAFWTNVPRNVWEYTLGGTQVLKKWLSYREYEVVSRDMTPQEVQDFTVTARRITSILLLTTELDANYHAVKENCYDWRHNNGAGVKDGISVQGKLASDRSRGAGVQI